MNAVSATLPDRPRRSWFGRHAVKLVAALLVVIGAAAYFVLAPYLTLWKLKRGVEARDAEGISECLDYPALRESLKTQLESAVSARVDPNNALGALAAGLALTVADGFVDRLVTPEGLAALMAGQKPALVSGAPVAGPAGRKPLDGASYGYESLGEFVVGVPAQGGDIRFVLTRSGLGWKLSRIEIPR